MFQGSGKGEQVIGQKVIVTYPIKGYYVFMAKTMYLPGFNHRLCGRRPSPEAARVRDEAERLDGLAALARRFIPADTFAGASRQRVFTPWVTFVAFLGQTLTRGGSCREAVRRVQAWRAAARRVVPDESTSAYCQARARLPLGMLRAAHEALGRWIEQRSSTGWLWQGRKVKVLDGSGLTMPDSRRNRAKWPYAGGQKPGCGFPSARLVGLFCLATGRLVRFAFGSWKTHELLLARQLVAWMEPGEVVLSDRGFCGWGFIALLRRKEVDVVMRLHQARPPKGARVVWRRPQWTDSWPISLWRELPAQLTMRLVRFQVEVRGFRTRQVVLATTLLDATRYPDEAIAALYRRRWAVEVCFRDIKTTLNLDTLRCVSPELVEKEIWLHAIAYNLVRALMVEAAAMYGATLERLSFKGTVDALRQWAPLFSIQRADARAVQRTLLLIIATDAVRLRPCRSEPRARKRRPKNYQLLTRPRHAMRVSPSRNRK